MVESRKGALEMAGAWSRGDVIWTNGSRLDDGRVEAACAWRTPSGWTRRRFHPGTNKEVFGAEVYAVYQALNIIDRRQENGHKYTVFVDSTAVIERVRSDSTGPGQRFAVAAIEVCTRLLPRTDEVDVTTRWVPAHYGVPGNEGGRARKAVAEGGSPTAGPG